MEASFQIPNCLNNGENIYTLRRQWKLSTLPFWRSVPLLRPLDSVSTLVFLSSISIPISMANTGEAGATRDREREGERERQIDQSAESAYGHLCVANTVARIFVSYACASASILHLASYIFRFIMPPRCCQVWSRWSFVSCSLSSHDINIKLHFDLLGWVFH